MSHFFNEKSSHLGTVPRAPDEISEGFSITYLASNVDAHHHGPHHGDSSRRAADMRSLIEKLWKFFIGVLRV